MASMDYVPIAVAKELKLFEKHHVDVEVVKFFAANDRDAALRAGNIDGTIIDITGAIIQKNGGVPLKITSACEGDFCIITQPNSQIHSVSDLHLKKVAVSNLTVIDFCVDMAIKDQHVEIVRQDVNKIPLRLEMILHGNSDATALPDPYLSIAMEKGAQKLICMSDLQLDVTAIVFLDKAIQEKQQPIQNFYHAYNQAVRFIQSHPDQLGDILIKDVGFSESNLQFLQMPQYQEAHMLTDQNMQITENWLRQKGILKEDFHVQSLLDDQFVQHNPNGTPYP